MQAGAGMNVAGRGYDHFADTKREAIVAAFPRETDFKHGIIDAFYEGMKHRPALKDPNYRRTDILASDWSS